ncbi:hypothetical protein RCH23_001211 [Cryobacterium sp. CAN_C3]|nr:hypothetical protein [Cryobacterium sp. CAN_C3]
MIGFGWVVLAGVVQSLVVLVVGVGRRDRP